MKKTMIKINQPKLYINFCSDTIEEYDYTLVACECGNLMERGVGLCEGCIERESLLNKKYLEKILCK